jgi:molybdenum cofactor guanylyltransferase
MKKHTKHTNIAKRHNGNFAPNEIALLGVKCDVIAELVHQFSKELSNYKLAYFDASHAKPLDSAQDDKNLSEFVFHQDRNLQVTTSSRVNKFEQRLQFAQYDFVFINGNHYSGSKQIVFLDPEKEASINKRIEEISEIVFFIKTTTNVEVFDSLKTKFPNWESIPQYEINEVKKITNHIVNIVQETIPKIKGLVLVGGKSTRMGKDKSELNYFGKPQKVVAKELLENNKLETFYSVRTFGEVYLEHSRKTQDDNKNAISSGVEKSKEIQDTFLNLGPFGGICSAFQKDPNSAWLALATDVPFVNNELIQLLLEKRNPSKVATAIKGKGKEFVEPLITIYEPKAYPILLQYLSQGYSCPRKMLINSDVEIVEVDDAFIRNVNTSEEFEIAKNEINNN